MIDLYCERLGAGFFAEPLNSSSNAAFLVAAYCAWRLAGSRHDGRILALLLAAIGCGSALFHTFASAWARWLDVAPIALFQLAWLWLYLRHCARLERPGAAVCLLAFALGTAWAARFPALFNGSLGYVPAAAALFIIALLHRRAQRPAGAHMLAAALLFAVALTLRTVDDVLCARWPYGTHWLWHLANALVLYLLIRAWLPCCERKAARPAGAAAR